MNKREEARIQSSRKYILVKTALKNAEVDFIPYPERKQVNVVTGTKHDGKYKVWNYWSASEKFYCSNTGEKGIGQESFVKLMKEENFAVAGIQVIVSDTPPKIIKNVKLNEISKTKGGYEVGVTVKRRNFIERLLDFIKSLFS